MASFFVSLRFVPIALWGLSAVACSVDTGNLFDGGGGEGAGSVDGGNPSAGGAPATGGNPAQGGGPTVGGNGPGPGGGGPGGSGQGGSIPVSCGNGAIDAGEDCDQNNLAGADCGDFGFVSPEGLGCSAFCTFDESGCSAVCGNGTVEPGEACDDGNEQPNDGCSTACVVEDGNCAQPVAVSLANGSMTVLGTTGGVSNMQPSNTTGCVGAAGPEVVFQVTPSASGYLTASLPAQSNNFDSVLYARQSCDLGSTQRLCHDNFGTPGNDGGELISFPVVAGTPVILVVDGYAANDDGDFTLELDLSSGDTCADPVPITIEGDAPVIVIGDTSLANNDYGSNNVCQSAGGGPDVVYQMTTPQNGNYKLDLTPSAHNSVIYARSACTEIGTQLACNSPSPSNDSSITLALDGNDVSYVYADGTSGNQGPYSLTINH